VLESQGQGSTLLLPDRNNGFTVKGQANTTIRFAGEKDQPANAISLETPGGVFTARRKVR
jgi:hypothetical protein